MPELTALPWSLVLPVTRVGSYIENLLVNTLHNVGEVYIMP